MTFEEFTKALRKQREARNISQQCVAEHMKTSKSSVSLIDNYTKDGRYREPRISTLIKYADAIGYELSLSLVKKK